MSAPVSAMVTSMPHRAPHLRDLEDDPGPADVVCAGHCLTCVLYGDTAQVLTHRKHEGHYAIEAQVGISTA